MKPVHFLQSGASYGYGYTAGENGLIREEDFARLDADGIVAEIVIANQPTPADRREKAVKQKFEKR